MRRQSEWGKQLIVLNLPPPDRVRRPRHAHVKAASLRTYLMHLMKQSLSLGLVKVIFYNRKLTRCAESCLVFLRKATFFFPVYPASHPRSIDLV
jgi:hypothetical protein